MEVVTPDKQRVLATLAEVERWAPRMDYADACAVLLVRDNPWAFALTTDFNDFSIYRVPFSSPEGEFCP
jgi:hypothetical protein